MPANRFEETEVSTIPSYAAASGIKPQPVERSTIPAYAAASNIPGQSNVTVYVDETWDDSAYNRNPGAPLYESTSESTVPTSSSTSETVLSSPTYDSNTNTGSYDVATNVTPVQNLRSRSDSFKVTLSCGVDRVVFEASMPIVESKSVNYSNYEIVHLPTDVWAYRSSSSRRFSLMGRIVSRTPSEADLNAKYIDLIRSWTLPDFGNTGATPPILRLNGYKNNNIDNIPILLMSYSINYADDVDWIFQGNVPMPVICGIQLEFVEAYSPAEITAKFWKMNINQASGMFSYGASATVNTAGGIGFGDSISNGFNIPAAIASNNFQGLAAIPGIGSTAQNLLGKVSTAMKSATGSSVITNTASTSSIDSPTANSQRNAIIALNSADNTYSRNSNLTVNTPTTM